MIHQLSVFMENRSGRILKLTKVLKDNGIDILSLSIADTKDFGILRCIVRDHPKAVAALAGAGFAVASTELIGVAVEDRSGGLHGVLEIFADAAVNIEYVYSYVNRTNRQAMMFLKVSEERRAVELLAAQGIAMLEQEML